MSTEGTMLSFADGAAWLLAYVDDPQGAARLLAELDRGQVHDLLLSAGAIVAAVIAFEDEAGRASTMTLRRRLEGLVARQ